MNHFSEIIKRLVLVALYLFLYFQLGFEITVILLLVEISESIPHTVK